MAGEFPNALQAQRNGNRVAARHIYGKLVSASPPIEGANNNLAILDVYDRELSSAMTRLQAELKFHPHVKAASLNQILLMLRIGKTGQAAERAQKIAKEIAPDHHAYSAAQLALGLVLLAEGKQLKFAADSLGKAIATNDPNIRAQAHFARGVVAAREKNWAMAEEDFKECIALRNDARARYNLAISLQRQRDYEAAAKQVEIARSIDPRDTRLMQLLAQLFLHMGHLEKAKKTVAAAIAKKPATRDLHGLLGAIHAKAKRYKDARDAFTAETKHFPDSETAWFNLGMVSTQLDELPSAHTAFARAAKINPANTAAVHNRNALQKILGL